MILSTRYNFIFVHIPKTGGTSIQNALRKLDPECIRQLPGTEITKHYSVVELTEWLGETRFSELNSFTLVRNPFERICSVYFYLKRDRHRWAPIDDIGSADEFIEAVAAGKLSWASATFSQASFVVDSAGRIPIRHIVKMEELDRIPAIVGHQLETRHDNRSHWDRDYRSIINADSRKFLETFYRKDFEAFGYGW